MTTTTSRIAGHENSAIAYPRSALKKRPQQGEPSWDRCPEWVAHGDGHPTIPRVPPSQRFQRGGTAGWHFLHCSLTALHHSPECARSTQPGAPSGMNPAPSQPAWAGFFVSLLAPRLGNIAVMKFRSGADGHGVCITEVAPNLSLQGARPNACLCPANMCWAALGWRPN